MIKSDGNILTNQLINFTLQLADNSLIMGHRLSEWTGHGPMLEQDIAISNIALDLIGQSRNFYQYAAVIKNSDLTQIADVSDMPDRDYLATEDTLAYLREATEFKNFILAELPNGDWAKTISKIFLFGTYQFFLYQKLIASYNKQLSAIAEKSLKEVTYHVRWSSEWMIRLGDGTKESHGRLQTALNDLWIYTDEMFLPSDYETACAENKIAPDVSMLKNDWLNKVSGIFLEATVSFPLTPGHYLTPEGKQGNHTEHLQKILLEMQYLQRAYPNCEW